MAAACLVEDSTLAFPGHIVIDDAQMIMRNSIVEGYQGVYHRGRYDRFPDDYFDDAPVMLFMSSDIQIYDSDLMDTFQLTDTDSYPQLYNYDYPFASDTSSRSLVTYTLQRNVNASSGCGLECTRRGCGEPDDAGLEVFRRRPERVLHCEWI